MKKKLLIIIPIAIVLLITLLIIISGTKEQKEYKLIELTGTELINTILENEKVSITYALYNEYDMKAKEFIENLEKTARQASENIYYVNISHTTFEFTEIMNAITSSDYEALQYFVFQDGELVVSNTYKSFKSMYKELNGKKYNTKIKRTSQKEKTEAIKKATSLYDEGDIAGAYNQLALAWDTQEAKTHYQNRPYYLMLGNWEMFEPDDELKNTKYTNFMFLNYKSKLYVGSNEGKIDGFEKPTNDQYTLYDIKIKDDYVYAKKDNEKDYKKAYKIKVIGKYKLTLTDEKNNKEYKFQYGY